MEHRSTLKVSISLKQTVFFFKKQNKIRVSIVLPHPSLVPLSCPVALPWVWTIKYWVALGLGRSCKLWERQEKTGHHPT